MFKRLFTDRRHEIGFPKEIVPLTSARFFAAFAVVLLHFEGEFPGDAFLQGFPLFSHGELAVDFFFILSGFVLAHVYMPSFSAGTYSHRAFVVKRLARVYPLHFVTLLFYVALALVALYAGVTVGLAERYDFSYLPAHLLLVEAWGSEDHGTFNYPSWSVSAEWFAYLIFPVYAYVSLRLAGTMGAAWTLLLAALGVVLVYFACPLITGAEMKALHNNFGILRILPEFALGAALWIYGTRSRYSVLGGIWTPAVLALAVVVTAYGGLPNIIPVLLLGATVLSLAEGAKHRRGIMSHPALKYGGEISYAMYMVHVPVMTIVFNVNEKIFHSQPTILVASIGVVLVVAASAAAHHLIEVPGGKLIRRIGLGLKSPQVVV